MALIFDGRLFSDLKSVREMADRYRNYAEMWRAKGRIEDADAMDEVVLRFEREAEEIKQALEDRFTPEGTERGFRVEEGGDE